MAARVADLDAARFIDFAVEGFVRAEVVGELRALRIDDVLNEVHELRALRIDDGLNEVHELRALRIVYGPTEVHEWSIARAMKRGAPNGGPP
jgi:hypothetical protein